MACWRTAWPSRRCARIAKPAHAQIGLADNTTMRVPVIETEEHIAAARKAIREDNAMFLTAIMEGKYLDSYLTEQGAAAPKVKDGDMKIISSPLDMVALNIYTPDYVRADPKLSQGLPGAAASGTQPAHGLALALCRAGSAVLGPALRQRIVGAEGALHFGEWLLVRRPRRRRPRR